MAVPQEDSHLQVAKQIKAMSDDTIAQDEYPPEPLDVTFGEDLNTVWVKIPKPGDGKDLVQKQMWGVWRTLCNICHDRIPVPDNEWWESAVEEFANESNYPVCFKVIPCYVEVQEVPPCSNGGGFGVRERWHKQKTKEFVVCARCWRRLGIAPTQLPVTPTPSSRCFEDGDVRPDVVVPEDVTADLHPVDDLDLLPSEETS